MNCKNCIELQTLFENGRCCVPIQKTLFQNTQARSTHKHARARTHKHATHGKPLHVNRFQNQTVLFDVGEAFQLIRTRWRHREGFEILQNKQRCGRTALGIAPDLVQNSFVGCPEEKDTLLVATCFPMYCLYLAGVELLRCAAAHESVSSLSLSTSSDLMFF